MNTSYVIAYNNPNNNNPKHIFYHETRLYLSREAAEQQFKQSNRNLRLDVQRNKELALEELLGS